MTEPESNLTGPEPIEEPTDIFPSGRPRPAFDPAKSDLRTGDSDESEQTLVVCWVCELAWDGDDWSHCPKCSADLVEVEKK